MTVLKRKRQAARRLPLDKGGTAGVFPAGNEVVLSLSDGAEPETLVQARLTPGDLQRLQRMLAACTPAAA